MSDSQAAGAAAADSNEVDENVDEGRNRGQMTIWEHLNELRGRLIKSIIAVGIGMVATFVVYDWILDFFLDPYCQVLIENGIDRECVLIITDPLDGFRTRLRVALFGGITLAMPIVLWQLWRFVTPALYPKEKKYAIPFVFAAVVLFLLGAGLAYWTFPRAVDFLLGVSGEAVEPLFTPGSYINLITFMMLAFGIGFEFPIVLVFLQLAGIIEPSHLRRARRFAIVGIVVVVAIITPSGDPFSLMALSIPMYIFYEASIIVGALMTRKRRGVVSRRQRRLQRKSSEA